MKSEINYSESVSHKNMDLEILGESFDEPYNVGKSTIDFYTKLSIIDILTGTVVYENGEPLRYNFIKRCDEEGLKKIVKDAKNNIEKLMP